jgi:hypothetical protein
VNCSDHPTPIAGGASNLLDGLDEVVPQVPAVCDLHRVRAAAADALGVGAGPVAAHDLHTGLLAQPRRGRCCSPTISIRSVSSVRTVNTKRAAKQFGRGHRGGT